MVRFYNTLKTAEKLMNTIKVTYLKSVLFPTFEPREKIINNNSRT